MLIDQSGDDEYTAEKIPRPGYTKNNKGFRARDGVSTYFAQTTSIGLFLDMGWNAALSTPTGYEIVEKTRSILRCSIGSELRASLPGGLPTPRLVFAWNPLRLDKSLLNASSLASLKEPAFRFRFLLDH